MSWYTSGKLWSFVGGAAAAVAGGIAAKRPETRKFAVKALAKGMQAQACCAEGVQSIREEASDMAAEARKQAQLKAELADRRAQIEARVRAEVEAEMAAEQA